MCPQLQLEILLSQNLILLIYVPHVYVKLFNVVLGLFKNVLVLDEITLQALYLRLELASLSLHVEDLLSKRFNTASMSTTMGCNGLLEILFELERPTIVDVDLCFDVLGLRLVPLGHFGVCDVELTLNVRILVVLAQTALMQRS